MSDNENSEAPAQSGTIIRAKNGDILRYDPTGLVMVLSDQVIADIARRLPASDTTQPGGWIDPRVLGDIDAWDVRRSGDWYLFSAHLPGAQGARLFRRLVESDDPEIEPRVIADGAGPLLGVFSIGGPRRAKGYPHRLDYPWHVVAPADDLGAVGHGGEPAFAQPSALEPLREATRDACLADALIARRHATHSALPLVVTRSETDGSGSVAALAEGTAYANLIAGLETLKSAAHRLGRPASIYAIGLDYTLEDVTSDGPSYTRGILALLDRMRGDIARLGLRMPPVLAIFDSGTHRLSDHPILRAQWELAWQGADQRLIYTAPGYMFRQDAQGRPDADAVLQMAEMEAEALTALHAGEDWLCPIFLLAERDEDPTVIRVRARALSDLVIDEGDPFGAGACCGFSLAGASNAPELRGVSIAQDDPKDILLKFDRAPEGAHLEVLYAFGQSPERAEIDFPQACGSIRDGWAAESKTGTRLHRWALPAALPVW